MKRLVIRGKQGEESCPEEEGGENKREGTHYILYIGTKEKQA